jgi:hypothetical protein
MPVLRRKTMPVLRRKTMPVLRRKTMQVLRRKTMPVLPSRDWSAYRHHSSPCGRPSQSLPQAQSKRYTIITQEFTFLTTSRFTPLDLACFEASALLASSDLLFYCSSQFLLLADRIH